MAEIQVFRIMENIKLIKKLEKVSLNIPDRILKISGYILNCKEKDYLEIIIYKGFSSSTTHPINPDYEKDIIEEDYSLIKCQLFKAPISENCNQYIKEVDNIELFLNFDFWY